MTALSSHQYTVGDCLTLRLMARRKVCVCVCVWMCGYVGVCVCVRGGAFATSNKYMYCMCVLCYVVYDVL